MFAEILLGDGGGQFGFHGEKMRAFDKGLQNNQINFFEGKKGESTVPRRGWVVGPEPWHTMAETLCPAQPSMGPAPGYIFPGAGTSTKAQRASSTCKCWI